WSKVFDQGWLRWKLNRDLPPPKALLSVGAQPAPPDVQTQPPGDTSPAEGVVTPRDQDGEGQPRRGESMISEPGMFHLLAFDLLGIDGLPLPRTDGYKGDPYLTDEQFQVLCIRVCELVPGQTAKDWWEASPGQRIALMR